MTRTYGDCTRCGVEVIDKNWGVTLLDEGAGLERYDRILFCDDCRYDFEAWLNSTYHLGDSRFEHS